MRGKVVLEIYFDFGSAAQTRQSLPGQIGNRPRQCGRIIQRLWPLQAHTELRGIIAEQMIHVVENLDVIAKEPDRLQNQRLDALGCNRVERAFHRWPDPRASARALALKGKPPARNFGHARRHQLRRVLGLLRVGIGALARPQTRLPFTRGGGLNGPAGHAVRRKQAPAPARRFPH